MKLTPEQLRERALLSLESPEEGQAYLQNVLDRIEILQQAKNAESYKKMMVETYGEEAFKRISETSPIPNI